MKKGERLADRFKKTFSELIANPKILIPDILFRVFIALLIIIFAYVNNMGVLYSQIMGTTASIQSGIISNILSAIKINNYSFLKLIISLLITTILGVLAGIKFDCIKYEMIASLIKTGKTSFFESYWAWKTYFWRVFALRMVIFLSFFLAMVIILFLGLIGRYILLANGLLIILISLILLLMAWFIIRLFMLFIYPSVFIEKNRAWKAIKNSVGIFLKNKKYVLFVFLATLGIALLGIIADSVFNLSVVLLGRFSITFVLAIILTVLMLIRILVGLFAKVWGDLFVFRCYGR